MTIKIGTSIEKLNDSDPYFIVSGDDVDGFEQVKTDTTRNTNSVNSMVNTDVPAIQQDIATLQKRVDNSVERIALSDQGQLVVTNFKGDKNLIQLPTGGASSGADIAPLVARVTKLETDLASEGVDVDKLKQDFGQIDHKIDKLDSVFTYSGVAAPTWPTEHRHDYYVALSPSGQTDMTLPLPAPTDGVPDGAVLHLTNMSMTVTVNVTPNTGETVDNKDTLTVGPEQFVLLIKNGSDWFKVLQAGTQVRTQALTPSMISAAVDNGDSPNSRSVKALGDGWWTVPASNTQMSGRPKGSQGDLILFKQSLTKGSLSAFGITMAFGNDNRKDPAMWIQYRDGTINKWTMWQKVDETESGDVATINREIAALKSGDVSIVSRLDSLETKLGNIYAPDKSAFDKYTNNAITAALAAFKDELVRDGWGPLKNIPGGGDIPLPQGIPKVWAYYGANFPTAIGATGQVSSTSGTIDLIRQSSNAQRIFIVVPNDKLQGDDVTGVSIDDGLKARWASRDLTLSGEAYRVFYSPSGYTEKTHKVTIHFGNK